MSVKTATGRVARVIGPVVDIEFPADAMPAIFNALNIDVTLAGETKKLTLEVAQHIGDNLVRAISMQPTDGMVRGATVTDTGSAISVPVGDVTKGHIHYPQSIEPLLASSVVPDKVPTRLKFRVWLEAGQTPRFIFPNGPYESRASVLAINKRYEKEFSTPVGSSGVGRAHILREGELPHIRISEIVIQGPVAEPSGGAEATKVGASVVPAPGRFSTRTGWPSSLCRWGWCLRA